MNKSYICESTVIHQDIIKKVRSKLQKSKDIELLLTLADFFKILGDPTRIKILQALSISEMCVCDLSVVINISQSGVSHQLRILRQANLVKSKKEGKVVYYSINDEHIKSIIDLGLQHINEK